MNSDRSVTLVFDDQLADRNTSISIRRFVAGVNLPNVSHYPLIGVSHVSPGIQLADLGAFIIGRRAVGDMKFNVWLSRLREIEWNGDINGKPRRGIDRWTSLGDGTVSYRRNWESAKKGAGSHREGGILRPGRSHSSSIGSIVYAAAKSKNIAPGIMTIVRLYQQKRLQKLWLCQFSRVV